VRAACMSRKWQACFAPVICRNALNLGHGSLLRTAACRFGVRGRGQQTTVLDKRDEKRS
jgi:hypothetical protein